MYFQKNHSNSQKFHYWIEVSSSFFFSNRSSVNTRICQIGLLRKAEMEEIDVIV